MNRENREITPKAVNAATKIQAGFRGYRVRKQYHVTAHHPKEQANFAEGNHHESSENRTELNPAMAATRIQAGYRGYRTRHALHDARNIDSNTDHYQRGLQTVTPVLARERTDADKAAAKIQASFRGYMTRRALAVHDQQKHGGLYDDKVANTDQKTPLRARNQILHSNSHESVSSVKSSDPVKLNNAATVIQAGFRGYHTRKALHRSPDCRQPHTSLGKENEEQAATRIQATYRGFMTRKRLKHRDRQDQQVKPDRTQGAVDENLAATKIQAAFRGFSTRQRVHVTHDHSHISN